MIQINAVPRASVTAILLAVIQVLLTPPLAFTQQGTGRGQTVSYYYEVWGASTKEPKRERPWSEPFDTDNEAQLNLKQLQRDHAKGGLLEYDTDHPINLHIVKTPKTQYLADHLKGAAKNAIDKVVEAKKAVDEAKKIAEEGLTGTERKLTDALKEYSDSVKNAYSNAKKAKNGLMSMTGSVARKQFDDVNKLIDGYKKSNNDLDQFRKGTGGSALPTFPSISRVTPKDLKATIVEDTTASDPKETVKPSDQTKEKNSSEAANIVGTKWSGTVGFDDKRAGSDSLSFDKGGQVTRVITWDSGTKVTHSETWVMEGNKVIVTVALEGGRTLKREYILNGDKLEHSQKLSGGTVYFSRLKRD